jgi:hypothetical protein
VIRVVVVSYDLTEAAARAARLCSTEIQAQPYAGLGTRGFRHLRADPPDAVVFDLMQRPSYCRALAALMREHKALRTIPLVFIEGDPEKTARVRAVLPDATYAPVHKLPAAIRRAIRRPPSDPVAPVPWTRPLLEKLGIGEGSGVALLHAPKDFRLPAGKWRRATVEAADVIISFYPNGAALGRDLPTLSVTLRKGLRLWIAWPKRAAAVPTDLSMPRIREMAQLHGLVDYKVCAIDEKWSGMVLGRRRVR